MASAAAQRLPAGTPDCRRRPMTSVLAHDRGVAGDRGIEPDTSSITLIASELIFELFGLPRTGQDGSGSGLGRQAGTRESRRERRRLSENAHERRQLPAPLHARACRRGSQRTGKRRRRRSLARPPRCSRNRVRTGPRQFQRDRPAVDSRRIRRSAPVAEPDRHQVLDCLGDAVPLALRPAVAPPRRGSNVLHGGTRARQPPRPISSIRHRRRNTPSTRIDPGPLPEPAMLLRSSCRPRRSHAPRCRLAWLSWSLPPFPAACRTAFVRVRTCARP